MEQVTANIGGVFGAITILMGCHAYANGENDRAVFLMLFALFCVELFTSVTYGR